MDEDFNRAAIEAINAKHNDMPSIESQVARMYEAGDELYREFRDRKLFPKSVHDINGEHVAFWYLPHQMDESGYRHHHFMLDAHGRFLLYVSERQPINGVGWWGIVIVDRDALLYSDEYECVRDKVTYVTQSLEWCLEELRSGRSLHHR